MATADWASMIARPVAQPNAVDTFNRVQTAGIDAATRMQAMNKEAYAQAVSMTVEALVAKSIDDRGNFDPKTYAMLARKRVSCVTPVETRLKRLYRAPAAVLAAESRVRRGLAEDE